MSCGAEVIRSTCQACGCSHERPGRCSNSLLCVRCRGAYQAIKRAAFLRARLSVLSEATARGLMRNRRKGRFSEKSVTRTTPHLEDDATASTIDRIAGAWGYFRRALEQHLTAKDAPTFDWFRVFEWTIGSDGLGHPHIHVWMLSAYLYPDHVRELWRAALVKAGCPPHIRTVLVHIEEFKPSDGRGAQELIKYLTKDIDANGDKVPSAIYAEVYEAFDGRRMTRASRGFMALAKQEARRCECGASLPKAGAKNQAGAALPRRPSHGGAMNRSSTVSKIGSMDRAWIGQSDPVIASARDSR